MVKRDKRNIGKKVKVVTANETFNDLEGIITGFRGDWKKGVPYVEVFLYKTNSIWPFVGTSLYYI